MRAAYIHHPGPIENIQVGELPDPRPRPGQVVVRVRAASVNPIDTYIRSGAVAMDLPRPYVVGCDLAGIVEEVGEGVEDLQAGDRVWGSNQGVLGRQGTFAEFAAVERQWLYRTPPEITDEQAAATALVGLTAQLGLAEHARLSPGETLLVSGGSGAVGSTVIQLARAQGARVLATTSGTQKARYCRELGADSVIDYTQQDVGGELVRLAPDGVDVWWETSRNPQLETAVESLAQGGRLVLMAGRDARPAFPVGPFYAKCCSAHGFVMFLASAESQQRAAEEINRRCASGELQVRIDRVASLAETAQLHHLQHGHTVLGEQPVRGKLVVRMG
jgi:NADPH2:quinone reductase